MITVNLQSGGTYNIAEDIVANIKTNSNGSEIVVVEAGQPRSIFSSQSPATVAALSPYFLPLTDIEGARVTATVGYSGLVNTIDYTFNIGAGRWSKLTDNGTNSLTAIAQLPQNISASQAIVSGTGYASVSSASYSYPSNTIYLNALRIKDVNALGFYGGSLVKYDEGGADLAEYELGVAPATLVALINALNAAGTIYSVVLTNNGTDTYTSADIDYSIPSGLSSFDGANLQAVFFDGVLDNSVVAVPVLPAPITTSIEFTGIPTGTIQIFISI